MLWSTLSSSAVCPYTLWMEVLDHLGHVPMCLSILYMDTYGCWCGGTTYLCGYVLRTPSYTLYLRVLHLLTYCWMLWMDASAVVAGDAWCAGVVL